MHIKCNGNRILAALTLLTFASGCGLELNLTPSVLGGPSPPLPPTLNSSETPISDFQLDASVVINEEADTLVLKYFFLKEFNQSIRLSDNENVTLTVVSNDIDITEQTSIALSSDYEKTVQRYPAPAIYKLFLNRNSGEIIELLTINLKGKFTRQSPQDDIVFFNSDENINLAWEWSNADEAIQPDIHIVDVSAQSDCDLDSRVAIHNFNVQAGVGTPDAPLVLNTNDFILSADDVAYPCTVLIGSRISNDFENAVVPAVETSVGPLLQSDESLTKQHDIATYIFSKNIELVLNKK